MAAIAIIGGSGLAPITSDAVKRGIDRIDTPYGAPSAGFVIDSCEGRCFVFLPRHGEGHSIPPHRINYRANIWGLKEQGVSGIMATTTVGSLLENLNPGDLVIPDQLIDYTWGREATFFDGDDGDVAHLEMTYPFAPQMRGLLLEASARSGIAVRDGCVYAVTQGPRFETPAEITRIARDGGEIVGMTAMPEASLAAELGLCYACISLVVNPAAGLEAAPISQGRIEKAIEQGARDLKRLIEEAVRLAPEKFDHAPRLLRP